MVFVGDNVKAIRESCNGDREPHKCVPGRGSKPRKQQGVSWMGDKEVTAGAGGSPCNSNLAGSRCWQSRDLLCPYGSVKGWHWQAWKHVASRCGVTSRVTPSVRGRLQQAQAVEGRGHASSEEGQAAATPSCRCHFHPSAKTSTAAHTSVLPHLTVAPPWFPESRWGEFLKLFIYF